MTAIEALGWIVLKILLFNGVVLTGFFVSIFVSTAREHLERWRKERLPMARFEDYIAPGLADGGESFRAAEERYENANPVRNDGLRGRSYLESAGIQPAREVDEQETAECIAALLVEVRGR